MILVRVEYSVYIQYNRFDDLTLALSIAPMSCVAEFLTFALLVVAAAAFRDIGRRTMYQYHILLY